MKTADKTNKETEVDNLSEVLPQQICPTCGNLYYSILCLVCAQKCVKKEHRHFFDLITNNKL
jgi:Na+-translocating ferredoxin:NAD+ oxidoreductase RNF subunit RnfB